MLKFDEARQVNSNAGWCWYQDDRVIVDLRSGAVLFASVANQGGADGEIRNGDIDVTCFEPSDGHATTVALAKIPTLGLGDDHNAAALWQRPDGRYLAMYTGHLHGLGINVRPDGGKDTQPESFYRISENPHDATRWGPLQTFTWPSNDPTGNGHNDVTYSNLIYLANEGGAAGRLYNVARAAGRAMHIATSDDWGERWTYRGILSLPPGSGRDYSNGYFKFAGNGLDRIDFIATEAHPRDYNNSIYHGYIANGRTHDAMGNVIDADLFSETAPPPEAFTPVFSADPVGPDAYHHGWTTSLHRGADGRLRALFTTRFGEQTCDQHNVPGRGDLDHRLFFAVLDESNWQVSELARMGPGLHPDQEDYTGLGAVDPRDGRATYVSTNIDPRTGSELPCHEIFRATADGGAGAWRWDAITEGSEEDNLRPQLAIAAPNTAVLLWLRGSYPHQRQYNQATLAKMV